MAGGNTNISDNSARAGLNTDSDISQVTKGYLTDALNAINSGFDGQSTTYQNEAGSTLCITVPSGYRVIGVRNIMQLDQVWYLLANPSTGNSLIGYVPDNSCAFTSVIDDTVPGSDLIGFDINHPVLKIEVKTTNCSTQIYFTDRFNNRRFVDFNDLPFKPGTSQVDTNRMNVQPQFSVPRLVCTELSIGGTLIEGCYQFKIQYSDIRGNGLTAFYSATNPVRVFADGKVSLNYNEQTSKAITVSVSDLDTTGLYSYFNLAVIKSINQNTSVEYVGTFPIQNATYQHTYTGQEQSDANIKLSLIDIMQQFDYYDIAGDLTQVDDVLVWADLIKEEDISYQKIWNQVGVLWETVQMPTEKSQGYSNGLNCANYQGHMRDEVYAVEGCFILDNGKQTTRCHIPGRALIPGWDDVIVNNSDVQVTGTDKCSPHTGGQPKWKVYNTATLDGSHSVTSSCDVQPYQFGKMSYWESIERYPNNPFVWGPLANQPIRHHKFPDSSVTHIHDQNPYGANDNYGNYHNFIYPIGFKVDVGTLWSAIQSSTDLSAAQKRQIVGFKIMRGVRGNNASITAKGLFFNMGMYTKGGSSYYYPNYPLNDTHPDVFIASSFVTDKSGDNSQQLLNDFQQSRYTFHSPDTHFYQPSGIDESFVKMETVENGYAKCHFVPVLENAGEKLRTKKAIEIALAAGILSMVGVNVKTTIGAGAGFTLSPTWNPQNFFPTYESMLEILDKLTPYINYGWQYNCVGYYGNYAVVPPTGNKQRFVEFGGYITSGVNSSFGDDHSINNINRESSVYISTATALPYSNTFGGFTDNTRVTATGAGMCSSSNPFYRDTSAYYGSIKRFVPGQYGQIFSYAAVDTGFSMDFSTATTGYSPAIFGGDIFINPFALKVKHPFYNKSTVNKPDGYDIDYNQDAISDTNTGNVGYPIWYYSTTNKLLNIQNSAVSGQITNFTNTFSTSGGIIASVLSFGLVPLAQTLVLMYLLVQNGLLTTLGIKITNLDCPNNNLANDADIYEKGMAYLYAYGVPRFFVESQVNVDMRQAFNNKEGDFYPHVGGDIPDNWLQETHVSIVNDNTYTYNKTYSKENKETAFTVLRPDWEPGQDCYINFNNRVIWSDKSFMEESKNNYLVYRPGNFFDFPKSFGPLMGINRMETRAVMVRYENHTQIYNAAATIETTAIAASLGTGALFSGTQPVDFNITDTGYMGTQNKMFLSTEHGHVFVDARRGKVMLVNGTSTEELSGAKYLNSKWFSNNLPFVILQTFPNINVDNNFNGIGLHGVYDNYYSRLIITKTDYEPINGVQFDGTDFYIGELTNETDYVITPGALACCPPGFVFNTYNMEKPCVSVGGPFTGNATYVDYIPCTPVTEKIEKVTDNRTIIQLGDPDYFCNKSWTISFSFITNSWSSWHSYMPNFYVEHENFYQSGYNTGASDVWDHNKTFSIFNSFRGIDYPYILEYPFTYQVQDEQLQCIEDYCTCLVYNSFSSYVEPDDTIYFTQVTIYNNQASTGTLNLIPKDINNRFQYISYPKFNANSMDILVTKSDHNYSYNMIWNNLKNPAIPQWTENCTPELGNKDLNDSNFDYTNKAYKKYPLRAKDTKVRLTMTRVANAYKLISKFILVQNEKMNS